MDNKWSFYNPTEILFGAGLLQEIARLMEKDTAVLLITTPGFTRRGLTEKIKSLLAPRRVTVMDNVQPNPDIDCIEADFQRLLKDNFSPDIVIGFGGGSAIDTAKVFSYLLANKETSLRHSFESGKSFDEGQTLPVIAVPTTAGTGSEVTPFATVWDKKMHKKYSLATSHLFPRTALLDPALTVTLPEDITVYTALDALSHALESFWNHNRSSVSTAYAVKSVERILKFLPLLIKEPENIDYRSVIMESSLFAGLAISNTRTALAHSLSYPLTARFEMPHGLACSFTLPAILAFNARDHEGRFDELIEPLGYKNIKELYHEITALFEQLGMNRRIRKYIPSTADLLSLASEMYTPGRADNNLCPVDEEAIKQILTGSL